MAIKIFTLEEARRTLPLIRRIASDVVEAFGKWQEIEALQRGGATSSCSDDLSDEELEVRQRILELFDELEQIGAVGKGVDMGLVDWYGEYEGRIVYFCWRLGEDDIEWFHEVDRGYAERQRLPASMLMGSREPN